MNSYEINKINNHTFTRTKPVKVKNFKRTGKIKKSFTHRYHRRGIISLFLVRQHPLIQYQRHPVPERQSVTRVQAEPNCAYPQPRKKSLLHVILVCHVQAARVTFELLTLAGEGDDGANASENFLGNGSRDGVHLDLFACEARAYVHGAAEHEDHYGHGGETDERQLPTRPEGENNVTHERENVVQDHRDLLADTVLEFYHVSV